MNRSDFIQDVAQEMGAFQMEHWGNGVDASEKGDAMHLVSFVDRECERRFSAGVQKHFPGDAIMGEESYDPHRDYASEKSLWIVDPLDGTLLYLRGKEYFGVLIAYIQDGVIRLGCIHMPALGNLYFADDSGSFKNGDPIHVSDVRTLPESMVSTPVNQFREACRDDQAFFDCMGQIGMNINYYSAASEFAFVAEGKLEGGIRYKKGWPWDVAAGGFLIQQAGGKVTKIDGSEWKLFEKDVLFSNGHIHEQLIQSLALSSS